MEIWNKVFREFAIYFFFHLFNCMLAFLISQFFFRIMHTNKLKKKNNQRFCEEKQVICLWVNEFISQLNVPHEEKWPTLMPRVKQGFTRLLSSGLCSATCCPVSQSWEAPWRTRYTLILSCHTLPNCPVSHTCVTPCSGRCSGPSVLPLGVPEPAGLHHDGLAGGPSHRQSGCCHPGCPAGHRLVPSQPDQVAEPRLGSGWVVFSFQWGMFE